VKVGRRVDAHFLTCRQYQIPSIDIVVPEHFRVSEISHVRSDDRISGIFDERTPAVGTVCKTLRLVVTGSRVYGDDCVFPESSRVVFINHATATEDCAESIRPDGIVEMLPMNKIAANGMSPSHVFPLRSVRIILIVEMIFAVAEEHSVRVVHPTIERSVMDERTVHLYVGAVESVGT